MRKHRGVFVGKDGRWWIEYWDADGRRRREKAGTLGTAKQLVEKRRDDARTESRCRRISEQSRLPSLSCR